MGSDRTHLCLQLALHNPRRWSEEDYFRKIKVNCVRLPHSCKRRYFSGFGKVSDVNFLSLFWVWMNGSGCSSILLRWPLIWRRGRKASGWKQSHCSVTRDASGGLKTWIIKEVCAALTRPLCSQDLRFTVSCGSAAFLSGRFGSRQEECWGFLTFCWTFEFYRLMCWLLSKRKK